MRLDAEELFRVSVDLLTEAGVEHFLIGGLAEGVWGEPRFTTDADFIVSLSGNAVGRFLSLARTRGFEIDEPVVLMNLQISGVARLGYRGTFLDCIVGESDFDRSAFVRRRRIRFLKRDTWVASPEDLILYKLVAMRDRDVDDVRRILIRQDRALDLVYLREWAAVLGEKIDRPAIPAKLEELLGEYGLTAP